ncbi:RNA polymerase sigma factor [Gimesia fumaroli]|uniref:ECF RNA polymerase sigma factor SigE n=1 Tax=Gimesia fumaroli TaxID=2527976 RepID=A0A518IJP9_9PLAN|nr:sigma-70 family RNA polymerase sigma factor [Gimesia fumaroli]QDV53322.1 ECF RNA polymerase sigma factor SigE [Gimesia fumaroli]
MTTDEILLHRYCQDGDPAAFRELIDRYAGMVYRIGLRVTGDKHTAEDLCQECFLELARKAYMVRENIAGWLHASATSRSLNIVRSRKRRTHREQVAANSSVIMTESSEWSEMQPLIDRALNGLGDDLRLPIVLHYLQGKTQQQVAEQLGVTQATMSRRLQRGIEQVRNRLRSFGVMTTIAAVTSFFGENSAQAASASLTASLAKIGIGGVGVTVAKSTPGGLLPFAVTLGAIAGNVWLFLFLKGWVLLLFVVIGIALLMRPPAWLRELFRAQAFGRDYAAHPMYPFRRWTWTIPPANWKQRLFVLTYVGITFGLVALKDPAKFSTRPGFVVAFGLMATLFLTLAVRLAWRIWTLRNQSLTAADQLTEQWPPWALWEILLGASFFIVIAVSWLSSVPREEPFSFSKGAVLFWSWFVASSGLVVWDLIERWRKRNNRDVSFSNVVSSEDSVDFKPVARRYHLILIGGLVSGVVAFLSLAMLQSVILPERPVQSEPVVYRYTQDGTRVRVKVPAAFKPPVPPKGLPSQLVMTAGMGFIFSLLLLRRVIKVRLVLPRSAWLPLLAVSSLAVALGAGLTANAIWATETKQKAHTAVDIPEILPHQKPVFNPSPSELARIRKYAAESAIITLPDARMPDGWYFMRYDNGFPMPMPKEILPAKIVIQLGLTDVPELKFVDATLMRIYMNPFVLGDLDSFCAVYAFCCGNVEEARRLNSAWENRGMCKGRLVIFVYGRKGLRAPSATDQVPIPSLLKQIQQSP